MTNINNEINNIIYSNQLAKENNNFFVTANTYHNVSLQAAFTIAANWREITKTFLFTVIEGIGLLASQLLKENDPSNDKLAALQTAYAVISDDLNNANSVFNKVAPQGVAGIHYKWWQNSILAKLRSAVADQTVTLAPSTHTLLDKMQQLARDPIGAAVQLRIVEAIAHDIAVALFDVCNKVIHNGQPFFQEVDMLWLTSHIQAECVHNAQVSDELSGMTMLAQTPEEQQLMLLKIDEYCHVWTATLNGFVDFLQLP
jgi:hypothetical protein